MNQNCHRIVGLIVDVDVNVVPPSDKDPVIIDKKCDKVVLLQKELQPFREVHCGFH